MYIFLCIRTSCIALFRAAVTNHNPILSTGPLYYVQRIVRFTRTRMTFELSVLRDSAATDDCTCSRVFLGFTHNIMIIIRFVFRVFL